MVWTEHSVCAPRVFISVLSYICSSSSSSRRQQLSASMPHATMSLKL